MYFFQSELFKILKNIFNILKNTLIQVRTCFGLCKCFLLVDHISASEISPTYESINLVVNNSINSRSLDIFRMKTFQIVHIKLIQSLLFPEESQMKICCVYRKHAMEPRLSCKAEFTFEASLLTHSGRIPDNNKLLKCNRVGLIQTLCVGRIDQSKLNQMSIQLNGLNTRQTTLWYYSEGGLFYYYYFFRARAASELVLSLSFRQADSSKECLVSHNKVILN